MEDIYEKLARLQWLLHMQQMRGFAARGPMADPSRGQGRILAVLKLQDGISTKDLAYLLGITVSSLNELLAKLERGGYITRKPSEADRRVILVNLTDKGRNQEQGEAEPGSVFAGFAPEELLQFGEYLDRLIAALEAELGEMPGFERMEALRGRFGEHMRDFGRFGPRGFDPRGGRHPF